MKIGINLNIDVTKLDKSKLYQGKKGKYASLTVFVDTVEADQFGNHGGIFEKQDKDDQSDKNFVGNARVFWESDNSNPSRNQEQQAPDDFEDDIPW